MGVTENLKNFTKEGIEQIVELFCIEKNRNNEGVFKEIEKAYLENIEKLYYHLLIETYEFLKLYFKNDGIVPLSGNLLECVAFFENFGLCPCYVCDSKDSIEIDLDPTVAKALFNFLNKNQKLISREIHLNNAISGILNCYLGLRFAEFLEVLKNLNLFKADYEIIDFLKYKTYCGIYDFHFNANDELFIINKYLSYSNETIQMLLNFDGKREMHSLEKFLSLSNNYMISTEVTNILNTIDDLKAMEEENNFIIHILVLSAVHDYPYEKCLQNIKDIVPALDIENSIVKENVATVYNKLPTVLKNGFIDPNRVIL